MRRKCFSILVCYSLVLLVICTAAEGGTQTGPATVASDQGLKPILSYISSAWDTLTRSMSECQSIVDPKIATQSVLYLPKNFAEPQSVQTLTGNCNHRQLQCPCRSFAHGNPTPWRSYHRKY